MNSVTLADDTAYIRVQDGFSEALSRRLVALATLSNDSLLATDLDVGQLKVTMDATNMQGCQCHILEVNLTMVRIEEKGRIGKKC